MNCTLDMGDERQVTNSAQWYMYAGFTVMHPALERPYLMQIQPMQTDISHFEKTPGFQAVKQRMIR